MNVKRHSRALVVLLLIALVPGPLKAQEIFTCLMMEKVLEQCCCEHTGRNDIADEGLGNDADYCCERSIELEVDETSLQLAPNAKSFELKSSLDPPATFIATFHNYNETVALRPSSPRVHAVHVSFAGTETYLKTRRLRI